MGRDRLTLLVVEDVPVNRLVTMGFLRGRGHVVTGVGDGAGAMAALRETHFDAVVMDIGLPDFDGIEATRRIRALTDGARANVPVIGLTASLSPAEKETALAVGMSVVLSKPTDPETLDAAIAAALAQSAPTPPAGVAPGLVPVMDQVRLDHLMEAFGTSGLSELLDILAKSIDEQNRLLATCDAGQEAEIAHRLAGAAANYGLMALRQAAKQVEEAALAGHHCGAGTILGDTLQNEIDRATSFLATLA